MSNPFSSQTQATLPMLGDPGHTITIRKLTGQEYEDACEAHRGSVATGRATAWPTFFRRVLEGKASDPDVLKALANPLCGHDRYALVRGGLMGWSYPLPVKPTGPTATVIAKDASITVPSGPGVDAVADLDDEAVDYIATEVLRLTKPHLFHTSTDDTENERKNDSSGSTAA